MTRKKKLDKWGWKELRNSKGLVMRGNTTHSSLKKKSRMTTETMRVKIDEIGERERERERETMKALVNHVKKLGIYPREKKKYIRMLKRGLR